MKGETKSAGFTIVETLLVLGITSVLFVMVMITLGGKQSKAQFQQSVRDIQTKVQQTINEVSTGYYPNIEDFTCTPGTDITGSTVPIITPAVAGTVAQGKNEQCVFLGKVMQFSVNATTPEQYNTYSIAGLRNATSWPEEMATPIDDTGINSPAQVNVTTKDFLTYGLQTLSMKYTDSSGVPQNTNVVGFVSQVGDLRNAATYESGSLDLVTVPGLGLGSTDLATVNVLRTSHLKTTAALNPAAFNPAEGVKICFKSGTTNDTALLSIGSNGHNLAVKLEIKACS